MTPSRYVPVPAAGSSVTTPAFGETERLAQTLDEQIVDQAHLGAHDLDRRIVGTGVFAQVGIVNGKKVFVEVEPRVFGAGECGGRHDCDHAQQQV